jgi:hypothetical protein
MINYFIKYDNIDSYEIKLKLTRVGKFWILRYIMDSISKAPVAPYLG